jgi:hypothetical protein
VTFWAHLFLGVIAAATLVMALIQVGALVYGWMLARQMARLVVRIEEEIKPLSASFNAVARDAARASSLAVAQVERVDRLFADLTARVEQTADVVQRAVVAPIREGTALMAGVKAALEVLREWRRRPARRRGPEDEDGLFIG